MSTFVGKSKPVSQDWGKDVDGSCRRLLERANLSARIGVKTLRVVSTFVGKSKPVSQDWGKDVDGSCRRLLEGANLSARIGVKTLTGRVDVCWKEQTCQPGLG